MLRAYQLNTAPVMYYIHLRINPVTTMMMITENSRIGHYAYRPNWEGTDVSIRKVTWEIQNSCNTIYPRNIVCFRYIIENTLHNGDDDDDTAAADNNNE